MILPPLKNRYTFLQSCVNAVFWLRMVKIDVYFSPVCPHCPGAKRLVAEVASRYGDEVEEIPSPPRG